MTEGSPIKSLILFAIPLILGDFLQQIYNATDTIIVGRYVSKQALAAIAQTNSPINMFLGFSIGISLGCTVCLSRVFGEKNREKMVDALNTVLRLMLIVAAVITAVSTSIVPFILKIAGTNADAYQDAKTYLTIYFAGISSQIAYNIFAGILRSVGDSRRPLIVLGITAVMNIGGDLLLVRVFDMGIAGTAIATVAAQAISAIILWFMIRSADAFDTPIVRRMPINMSFVKNILSTGIPYAVQRAVLNFSNTTILSYGNSLGSDFMAAWGVCNKLDAVLSNTLTDLTSALTTFVSQNIGAHKLDRIKQGTRATLLLAISIDAFLVAMLIIFTKPLVGLFTPEPQIAEYAKLIFCVCLSVHPLTAISNAMSGKLRGMGSSTFTMVLVVFNFVAVRQLYLHLLWDRFAGMTFFCTVFPVVYIFHSTGCVIMERILSPRILSHIYDTEV